MHNPFSYRIYVAPEINGELKGTQIEWENYMVEDLQIMVQRYCGLVITADVINMSYTIPAKAGLKRTVDLA